MARYLTPMIPGLLLGLALVAQRLSRRWRLAPATLIALQFGLLIGAFAHAGQALKAMNFQVASEALMRTGTRRRVFLWDDPSARGGDRGAFGEVGGFFFHRAGRPIPVDPIFLAPGEDPNPVLLAHAAPPGTGILWLYDTAVAGTEALSRPPLLEFLDPSWRCRDFGDGSQHVVACALGLWT